MYRGTRLFHGKSEIKFSGALYVAGRVNNRLHRGVDVRGLDTLVVRSAMPGTVLDTPDTDSGNGLGIYVEVEGTTGLRYLYGHLKEKFVKKGDIVKIDSHIGLMGQTGNASSDDIAGTIYDYPHLHFEVRDPNKDYLGRDPLLGTSISPYIYAGMPVYPGGEFTKIEEYIGEYTGLSLGYLDKKYYNFVVKPELYLVQNTAISYYWNTGMGSYAGKLVAGKYLIASGPIVAQGYVWYEIFANGRGVYVPVINGITQIVEGNVSNLPTDRVPDEWVQQRRRDAAALEAQQAALEGQAAEAERQQAVAEARERAEAAARQAAEDRVRAKEVEVDALAETTQAKLDAHRQWTQEGLAALWAESDEKLLRASGAAHEVMNALQVWAMGRMATLYAKADRARNPVNGRRESMEAVLEALFDEHRRGAIQAGEYGMLYLTGPQYDSYDMTAYVYDTRAREILWELLEQYLSYSLSAREYHDLQMTARLFDVHGLTVRQYDTAAKLYYQP